MKELGEIVRLSKEFVSSKKTGRPNYEVEFFIAHALGFSSRLDLYLYYDKPLHEDELSFLRNGVKKLSEGVPLAYLIGTCDFYGSSFYITPDVLIPRPETELLVEKALIWIDSYKKKFPHRGIKVLDLCSGSGCIGISIKKMVPEVQVDLSDISPEAVAISQKNSIRHNLDISCSVSDLFSHITHQYDLIVSNPPYLSEKELLHLDDSVRLFEPHLALLGGINGTEIYMRIAEGLHKALNPHGVFLCEIGAGQAKSVSEIIKMQGFVSIELFTDYYHRDRVLFCKKEESIFL